MAGKRHPAPADSTDVVTSPDICTTACPGRSFDTARAETTTTEGLGTLDTEGVDAPENR